MVAVAKGTLRALGTVTAGFTDHCYVEYPRQVLENTFDGLGHGSAESPADATKGAG